ncbi:uncharacterized protein LOC105691602 [Athalia rosae]|uniref:uncharacterized protein LOC105691602 n=1 Tax=Athalia rosae TaxID=37344 RepID=UPI0020332AA5|nr:uncharacterized protein LOC105691602 [Athalia rosae]
MSRSKATVALMKLKEIDRKYKIKSNEDIKCLRYSSLSEISSIDSEDPIRSDHGFGDNGNLITTRTKLDIRIPDTYVNKQRSLEAWKNESGTELPTIFNEFDDTSSRLETIHPQVMIDSGRTEVKRIAEPASEGNLNNKYGDVLMSEKSKVDMASLISKEVIQIQRQSTVRSSHLVLNKSNTCTNEEITVKSVESMIHVEEDEKCSVMEDYNDQSTLVASVATYSEDFVKTPSDILNLEVSLSLECGNKSSLTLLDQSKVRKDQQQKSLLLRTEATVSEVEECDTASGANLNDYNIKSIELSVNSNRGSKKQRKSPRDSTVNSTRESYVSKPSAFLPDFEKKPDLRRSQSPHTAALSKRDQLGKKKTKVSQNLRHERASMAANIEEKKKLEKIRTKAGDFPTKDFSVTEKPRQCSQKNINPDTRTKCSDNFKTEEIVQGKKRGAIANVKNRTRINLGSVKQEAGFRYHTKDVEMMRREIRKELRLQREKDHLRDRFRCYVVKMMEKEQRFMTTGAIRHRDRDDRNSASDFSRQTDSFHEYFFKPLDLPNVATFKRPDLENDTSYDFGDNRHLHLSVIRERILGIRHWLKQHFVLYKDYSKVVSTMNSEYVPVTLQETKKMIRDVQRFYKRERLRHVR